MEDSSPDKPLALSLFGPTGVGKTLTATIVMEEIQPNEAQHVVINFRKATWNDHDRTRMVLRRELLSKVEAALEKCKYTVFRMDEPEHLRPGVLDVLTPLLLEMSTNKKARYAVFLFNGNHQQDTIMTWYQNWLRYGSNKPSDRDRLEATDLNSAVKTTAEDKTSCDCTPEKCRCGWVDSELMSKELVTSVVYLPHDRVSVEKCVQYECQLLSSRLLSNQCASWYAFVFGCQTSFSCHKSFSEHLAEKKIEYDGTGDLRLARTGCRTVKILVKSLLRTELQAFLRMHNRVSHAIVKWENGVVLMPFVPSDTTDIAMRHADVDEV